MHQEVLTGCVLGNDNYSRWVDMNVLVLSFMQFSLFSPGDQRAVRRPAVGRSQLDPRRDGLRGEEGGGRRRRLRRY